MCNTKNIIHKVYLVNISKLETAEEVLYGNKIVTKGIHPKCNNHQRHISFVAKKKVIKTLAQNGRLIPIPTYIQTFEDLHKHVQNQIGSISGVGDLTIYDVAVRLGAINGILPQDYVYLHAGPLKSARHLDKIGAINLPKNCVPCVPITALLPFCKDMSSFDIEVELCEKKEKILQLPKYYNGLNLKDL